MRFSIERLTRLAALLLAIAGLAAGLVSLVPFQTVRPYLDGLAGDGSAEPYTATLHGRLQLAGQVAAVTLIVAGLALHHFGKRNLSGLADAASRQRDELTALWESLWVRIVEMRIELTLLTILGIGLRATYLSQPGRFDECYTWLQYVRWPWYVAISRYDAPNNHVFYSLSARLTTTLFGDDLWAIRLPAFLAGCLLVPVVMLWARQLSSRRAAVFAGAFIACSAPLVEYSTNARGYTIVAVVTCLTAMLLQRLAHRREITSWIVFVVLAAVGCWTIPIMVYPITILVGLGLLMTVFGPTEFRPRPGWLLEFAVALFVAGCLTLLLYVPILLTTGLSSFLRTARSQPLEMSDFWQRYPESLIESAALLFRDQSVASLLLLFGGMVLAMVSGPPEKQRFRRMALVAILGVIALPVLQQTIPFGRVWLFLLPWIAVLAASGLADVANSWSRSAQTVWAIAIVLCLALLPAERMIRLQSVLTSLETGVAPDARAIVEDLPRLLHPGEPVLSIVPLSAPVTYYALQSGLADEHLGPQHWDVDNQPSLVLLVDGPAEPANEWLTRVLEEFGFGPLSDWRQPEPLAEYPQARVVRLTRH